VITPQLNSLIIILKELAAKLRKIYIFASQHNHKKHEKNNSNNFYGTHISLQGHRTAKWRLASVIHGKAKREN
jgi:hypothetical protein